MANEIEPLAPGSVIGILGGGQLGRMLATSAIELGFRCHVLCPDPESPAFDASRKSTVADYGDEAALAEFASTVDVVTYEFENVPAETAAFLEARVPVRPGREALAVAQDRIEEKRFAARVGAETANFWQIDEAADLEQVSFDGSKYVLKTRRLGYDGKGQAIVETLGDAKDALVRFDGHPSILEAFVPFEKEISVILARAADGRTEAFEPGQNTHTNQILAETRVPADLSDMTRQDAISIAARFADALHYVGILGVEFFVARDENGGARLLVNEIAPRVHNSGHWTQDGATASQFEQHIRAIAGWPLVPAQTRAPTIMQNLIGADADEWLRLASESGCHLHLYGKTETRAGRKMGHVNWVGSD